MSSTLSTLPVHRGFVSENNRICKFYYFLFLYLFNELLAGQIIDRIPYRILVEKVAGVIRVFTSTATGLPWLFDYDNKQRPRFLPSLFRPHWDHHAHPSFAFTPLELRYEGPIFGRLRFDTPDNAPPVGVVYHRIDGHFMGYALHATVRDRWQRLEDALCLVIYLLCKRPECLEGWEGSCEWEQLPLPRWFGYTKYYGSKEDASRAARRSRQAFNGLAGMCSYTIALCHGSPTLPNPFWISHLSTWVHPGWLADLQASVVGTLDDTVKRRGVLIHVSNCRWKKDTVDSFIASSVPVWFYWGDQNKVVAVSAVSSFLTDFMPVKTDVANKLREFDTAEGALPAPRSPSPSQFSIPGTSYVESHSTGTSSLTVAPSNFSALSPCTHPTTVGPDANPEFPQVEKGSRQRPGQDWRSFFEQQGLRHAQLYSTASQELLQKWADSKRANEYGYAPGKKGAVVWEWEDVDGFFIRKRVPRATVEDVFYQYGPTHKRYNPIDREWDLHYQFDPDTPAPDNDYDESDRFAAIDQQSRTPQPPSRGYDTDERDDAGESAPLAVGELSEKDISRKFISDMEYTYGTIEDLLCTVELHIPLLDLLRNRYGLVLDDASQFIPGPQGWNCPSDSKLRNILLSSDIEDERVTQTVSLLVHLISQQNFRMTEAPNARHLWDLSEHCGNTLAMEASPRYCCVGCEQEQDLFIVRGHDGHHPCWDIMVQQPLTLLECQRRFYNTRKSDIILHLIRTGTPFLRAIDQAKFVSDAFTRSRTLPHDLLPGWRLPLFVADDKKSSLGCRWPGYQPDHTDYVAYWNKLVTFLRGPRGHLAATMGGIVWRLAVQALGVQELNEMVLSGNTFRSSSSPQYKSRNSDHRFYGLETLSAPELEFITGTYYVYTDKGVQVSKQSWWPQHHTWLRSGRDMGHWTQSAEEWFHKRLATIRKDPATALKTPKVWDNTLKFEAKALQRFIEGSNQAAKQFLMNGPFP
jgi:hypothetical protein